MTECPVCCEKYNQQLRACVSCPNGECTFSACKTCIRTYIMNSTSDPHCMSCRKTWDQDFIIINLNRSFYENTYKTHRKNLLFDREQSKIPDTMNDVARIHEADEKAKGKKVLDRQIKELQQQIFQLNRQKQEIDREVHLIKTGKDKEEVERRKFIMPCPSEDCRGFLSSAYKCEVCKLHSCPRCLTVLGENKDKDHVCNEDDVKTADYIKSTTKPCPKCGERISKINGCDQMWCTSCHTAFSWRTGLEDKGAVIHNPHYYQYQREVNNGVIPRNPGDNPCEMDRRMYASFYHQVQTTIINYLFRSQTDIQNYKKQMPELKQEISENIDKIFALSIKSEEIRNIIRVFNHYNWELNHLNTQIQQDIDHKNLRIDYILKKKTKKDFEDELVYRDSRRKKNVEILNILQLIDTVGHDIIKSIFGKLMGNNLTIEHLKEVLRETSPDDVIKAFDDVYNELMKFIEYCNDKFAVVSVAYNISIHNIRGYKRKINMRPARNCEFTTDFIETFPTLYSNIQKYESVITQYEPKKNKFKIKSVKGMKSC